MLKIASKNKQGEIEVKKTQYLVDENGKKIAVVMPIEEYEEFLEDIHDLAVIAERKDEPVMDLEEVKELLKSDGLLR